MIPIPIPVLVASHPILIPIPVFPKNLIPINSYSNKPGLYSNSDSGIIYNSDKNAPKTHF